MKSKNHSLSKVSLAGFIITLGIVYGDIGTSPLYVLRAIVSSSQGISELLILGGISCIIWTLTLQTTIKYVMVTIRADNKGEGGIFALYALIRKKAKWVFVFAIIGGATLLADGIITPAITVVSAIEGLNMINPNVPIIPIVIAIICAVFLIQQFGTGLIGKSFGPIMFLWFAMLAVLGFAQLVYFPAVLKAFNPYYAVKLLSQYPGGFLLLGAVFLCTTGAEALYSDIGHCGIKNIRATWIYVKIALVLNYLGQGAWLLSHANLNIHEVNPFYAIMPSWFLVFGIGIATTAAVIASQALISGSFSIINEAILLNFWPKSRIIYPTQIKGQLYIPSINRFLWISCILVILFFQESSKMEAAYGLSITITMLMTTILLGYYFFYRKLPLYLTIPFVLIYLSIEGSFLLANLNKFTHGGWVTIAIAGLLFVIMYVWQKGRAIKNRFIEFIRIAPFADILKDLKNDNTIQKYATNLVYLTKANRSNEVESKIIYSIINKQPKRADMYWLVHIDIMDEPNVKEFKVTCVIPDTVIKVDFKLGFRVQPRINLFFKQVIDELIRNNELNLISNYPSLHKHKILGDFRFIIIDRIQNYDFDFPPFEQFIMDLYSYLKRMGIGEVRAYGMDTSNVVVETVPLAIPKNPKFDLTRTDQNNLRQTF
ncbi:MAG: KUP/HAK/KT family potassium transporter [Bacteroidota bacterium]